MIQRTLFLGALLLLTACLSAHDAQVRLAPREEAQAFLQRGDGAAALPLLTRLQAKTPGDVSLARMVAEAHLKAGSAMTYVQSLATQDTALSHYQRALILFAQGSESALSHFRRAIELAPQEPEFRFRLGVALLESERDELAHVELEAAVTAAPERTSWFLPLAKARFRTQDSAGAREAIRTVVNGEPSPADVRIARALMDQLSDPFLAFPRSARPQLEQAIHWLEVADVPQQAIGQLEEILRNFPEIAIVHTLLGLSWARLDDAGRAVEEFKRAIELAPEDGKNFLYLGQLYETRQRAQSAEEAFQKAIDRNPMLDQAWLSLGEAALNRQDYPAAKRHFQIVSHLLPESASAHGKLALVHQLQGDWQAADGQLRAVLTQAPDNLEFMLRLGVLHTERFTQAKNLTEREEASREATLWLRKVLAAQPENALASRALQRLSVR